MRAEGAAARGLWVAGFVAYELRPGLDLGAAGSGCARRATRSRDTAPRVVRDVERREDTALPELQGDAERLSRGAWQPSIGAIYAAIAAILSGSPPATPTR